MSAPPESIYQFEKSNSGVHFNTVSFDVNKMRKTFYVVSNADGCVDIIEKGEMQPSKRLPIEAM